MSGIRYKFVIYFWSCIICFTLLLRVVLAYDFPTNSNYISGNASGLGNVSVYFPIDKTEQLAYEGGRVINVGSSSVTGYFVRGGTDYTVSCPVFTACRYRFTTTGTYQDLVFTGDIDTNISFVSQYDVCVNSSKIIVFLLFGGVLLVWVLYMSKSRR